MFKRELDNCQNREYGNKKNVASITDTPCLRCKKKLELRTETEKK